MTKIMLVEDDKSLREIYGVRLLAEGYDIVSAGDGEEALAMAIKDRPQLIISDVMMPKISGFDMLDILRSTTETKNIKVIMMTALSSDEQRQRGEQLGADKYLVKSQVGIEDVVKAVHEVLQDKPGGNAPAAPPAVPPPSAPQPPPAPTAAAATPTFNTAVSGLAPTEDTTIPEPTAPFTGQRPATLGDRVIQPLKDNPRVSNVDVSDLMDKEFASNIQNVENAPGAPEPVSTPIGSTATTGTPPIQSLNAVSMDPPTPPEPAADDGTDLAALATPKAPLPASDNTSSSDTPSQDQPAQTPASPMGPIDRSSQPISAPDRVPPSIPSYE
jgi:CheY-like chemotaxis protein